MCLRSFRNTVASSCLFTYLCPNYLLRSDQLVASLYVTSTSTCTPVTVTTRTTCVTLLRVLRLRCCAVQSVPHGRETEEERGEVCKGRGKGSHVCVCLRVCVSGGGRAGLPGSSGRCERDHVRCARQLLSAESVVLKGESRV